MLKGYKSYKVKTGKAIQRLNDLTIQLFNVRVSNSLILRDVEFLFENFQSLN